MGDRTCRNLRAPAWLAPLCASAILVAPAAPAVAQDQGQSAPSAEITLDLGSHYVWRGLRLSEGPVAQCAVGGELGGFSLNLWSNYDPREYPRDSGVRKRITETDFTASYSRALGRGAITGGLIYYGLRGSADTSEVFVAYDLEAPLRPSATLYLDLDEGDGGFVVLGLGHTVPLFREVSLELGLEAGFNLDNQVMGFDANDRPFTGPYHAAVSASTIIPIRHGLAIASSLAVSTPLGSRAARAIEASSYSGNTRTCVYGSVGLSVAFAPSP